ncbi:MAG: tRNA (N6-isopentenyl adenosine(37)-C2)-methylthiotransferase MiaB [Chloroflexi bacterium]|nr:tRNA (N6-isopentenyl adenosine(37)-C2)-methylthiotransferase MiaB [Chloroflexota bacterium]
MKHYYLWTSGCQMNDADAARIAQGLSAMGFQPTHQAERADLVILLTCVVRQSAEDKVVGRLSSLKSLKRQHPHALITVMGCFVDDEQALSARFPYVDAFFKPSDIEGLLQFVRHSLPAAPHYQTHPIAQAVCAYVPISYGCDHHCTYCIVRLRRGKQRSRPLPEIVAEVRSLVQRGVREVTLLGQNVDAYGQDLPPGAPDLADVLLALHEIEGLWRIRFLTSHPADMSLKIIKTVASSSKICPHFELPVQSGDDEILRRMGRRYTVAQYRELVRTIREHIPGCSIATDVIVGFPGESEAQFQATYDLLASLRFDTVHIAKYSPRPGTPATRLPDDVPPEEKERRRALLEKLQIQIATEINAALLGKRVEVLVEKYHRGRWKGRTPTDKLVFFEDTTDRRGQLVTIAITHSGPWSLLGKVV